MGTLDKGVYKNLKSKAEKELRNYPYYSLTSEIKTNPEKVCVVNCINYVYERLDDTSKDIVDLFYFRDDHNSEEIINKLMIDKNKFYKKKKKALDKFIIVLDNIC